MTELLSQPIGKNRLPETGDRGYFIVLWNNQNKKTALLQQDTAARQAELISRNGGSYMISITGFSSSEMIP